MAIRDRGKIKWNPASFMPEGFAMTREMYKDQMRQAKPILDEYQTEEFDLRIKYAMEYRHAVKISVWCDGFITDYTGGIQRVEPITHELRLEVNPGEYERIAFDDVTAVKVVD
ncbi:YolD-like family protein [Neobacillus sp. DY30]|uniref:YolD-like family protein n=1 Tax=Neobacillus sp. DY30 TaxID=3047871 RepID=UPI0024BF3926|nr:YolD-like family protein [Neobacillus sp. DY30]WHY02531.1 YolD-like family protein [Neobacillus sp. DY30]